MKSSMARIDFKKQAIWISLLVVLTLAACQAAAPAPTAKPAAPAAAAPVEATINVATDATLGKILVGNKGMTVYIFTTDVPDKSNCVDKCLAAWPPLLTLGKPVLGAGVDAAMVGKVQLADGTWIVTYNHMPLYYFIKDKAAGDVLGQKVAGTWFVIGPDGKAIGMP
jgi:predicted lipoprotein with Yx(FWY)xxD motif